MLDDQVKNHSWFAIKLVLLPFQRPKPPAGRSLANKEPERLNRLVKATVVVAIEEDEKFLNVNYQNYD